jgi:acyl carrier protein
MVTSAMGNGVATLKPRLRRLIQESTGIPAELVTDEASFEDVLAVDSLSLAALQVNIESTFRISISVDELNAAGRFDRIAQVVADKRVADKKADQRGTGRGPAQG